MGSVLRTTHSPRKGFRWTNISVIQPQVDVTVDNMACNGEPNPTTPSDKIIPVTAGSDVTAVWRHTLECLSIPFPALRFAQHGPN